MLAWFITNSFIKVQLCVSFRCHMRLNKFIMFSRNFQTSMQILCTSKKVSFTHIYSFNFTWVTIETIAQQKPPMKAVMNIVSTDFAKTVKIHESENGRDIKARTRLRPYCMANPPNIPPKRAPSSDKLATQLASWSETEKLV